MKNFRQYIKEEKSFTKDEAKKLGDDFGVDWKKVDLEQFRQGLGVESEHDKNDDLDVVKNKTDLIKIVLAHLRELPDYYDRLKKAEKGK